MAAKWRRCQKCRKVLSEDEFEGDSEICRIDAAKADAPPVTRARASTVVTTRVAPPAHAAERTAGQTATGHSSAGQTANGQAVAALRGRGDNEVRARRARVRALERLAELHAEDFDHLLREERTTEGL